MKVSNENVGKILDRLLARYANPVSERMQSAIDRVEQRLQEVPAEEPMIDVVPVPVIRRPVWVFATAAAMILIAVVVASVVLRKGSAPVSSAIVENTLPPAPQNPVSPVESASALSTVSMEQIESGQVFHSDGPSGTTLILPDDSHVELRTQTELSFDRAADGLRILLKQGSILVSAAKQRIGHLYVKTKDVTVSVVGTVFLVNAEPEGSRVAVIEGEVHVQKDGGTERLFPGEQVATSPAMAARPVIDEISWSRRAEEHFAMLQQSPIPSAAASAEPQDTFEVASIRPSAPMAGGGAGVRGGGGAPVGPPPCLSANAFAIDLQIQLDPGRLAMRFVPLYTLVGFAYGSECPAPDTLTGGPAWARTEDFDLQATIPAGTPRYTKEQLLSGNAPQLQRMLQNLLADRFKLVLKREVKEMQGYNLVVAQQGKLKLSAEQSPDQTPEQIRSRAPRAGGLPTAPAIPSLAAPISRLISMLQRTMGGPIVDKTELTGLYDIWLEFPELPLPVPSPDGTALYAKDEMDQRNARLRAMLPAKLEATTGLRLERAKVPAQVLVIVSAEKPSPN
jgi:uncharacterized protein (TIGR03435 family)